ncbi:MAG: DNA translocase FtsK 4TM domain-containing protein, partial [Polaribacter sp.]
MIKKATKNTATKTPKTPVFAFLKTRQSQTIMATFLILFACFLTIAFISFFFNWQEDQSTLTQLSNKNVLSKNLLGKIGANLSHFFIYKGFGIGAFIIAFQIGISGLYLIFQKKIGKIILSWNWGLLTMLWISIAFGFLEASSTLLSGTIGYEVNDYLQRFLGKTGLAIVLTFFLISYLAIRYKLTADRFVEKLRERNAKKAALGNSSNETTSVLAVEADASSSDLVIDAPLKSEFELSLENLQPTISKHSEPITKAEEILLNVEEQKKPSPAVEAPAIEIEVEKIEEEKSLTENLSDKIVKDFGEFDPTLELSNFKFPTFNLLKQYNETIS